MFKKVSDNLDQFIHLPVFLAITLILLFLLALPAEVALEHVYDPPHLLLVLNVLFVTVISFWIAWQALRGYRATGFLPFIVLGCALLSAGGAATLAGFLIEQPDGVNFAVTVYNLGLLMSAALHFANALLLERGTERIEAAERSRRIISAIAYLAVFLYVGGIWAACRQGIVPMFYVPGVGPETIREVVLTVTILLLGISAYRLGALARQRQAGYLRWYGYGLALIALGLFGVAVGIPGSPISWTGRATQYLGNLYLLAAAAYAFKEARHKGLGWEDAVREFFREPEGRYRTLVESARSAIVSVDRQGKVFLWNPSAEKLFGYAADEAMGQVLTGLIAAPGSREELERLIRKSPRGVQELTMSRKGGGEFEAEFTVYGLTGRDEKSLNIRDITERKLAERSIKRQAAVLAGINRIFQEVISSRTEEELGEVCLAVAEEITESRIGFLGEIDNEGRLHVINFSNPSWEACRVVHPEGHRKPTVVLKIHGLYGRVLREGRSLLTNDPSSDPDRVGLPPGHPPLLSFLGVPLQFAGRTLGMVAVGNRDGGYGPEEREALEALTPAIAESFQRKRAEEALREAKEMLEQRVRERTMDLLDLTVQLERSRRDLRHLASELVLAEERERRQIAVVLHDEIAQNLAAVRMRHDMLGAAKDDDASRRLMAEAKSLLQESIQKTRSLMMDLANPLLTDMGLDAACRSMAGKLMETNPVRIHCDIRYTYRDMDPDLKTILFQAIREMLNNVVKHSRARNARVTIDMEDGVIRAEVRDDGKGFDTPIVEGPTAEGGFGLFSIRERLAAFGGNLQIDSSPGHGTVVTAALPVAPDRFRPPRNGKGMGRD